MDDPKLNAADDPALQTMIAASGAVARLCITMIAWEEAGAGNFEALLDQTCCFRRANGEVIDKKTFQENLSNSAHKGRTLVADIDVVHYETMAVAVLIIRQGGADYRNVRIFLRGGGIDGWRLQMWCNQAIPPKEPT